MAAVTPRRAHVSQGAAVDAVVRPPLAVQAVECPAERRVAASETTKPEALSGVGKIEVEPGGVGVEVGCDSA